MSGGRSRLAPTWGEGKDGDTLRTLDEEGDTVVNEGAARGGVRHDVVATLPDATEPQLDDATMAMAPGAMEENMALREVNGCEAAAEATVAGGTGVPVDRDGVAAAPKNQNDGSSDPFGRPAVYIRVEVPTTPVAAPAASEALVQTGEKGRRVTVRRALLGALAFTVVAGTATVGYGELVNPAIYDPIVRLLRK